MSTPRIITIGLSPCWDITCWASHFAWGSHQKIERQDIRPAGKALNVSQALAWLGQENLAAGFWGDIDYDAMLMHLEKWPTSIDKAFTPVPGRTRLNITLVDQGRSQEMHLRAPNDILNREAFVDLQKDLEKILRAESICVFAGSMPGNFLLDEVLNLIRFCQSKKAKIVVDTSGAALNAILELGGIWIIKPNVAELGEIMGVELDEEPTSGDDFREVLEGRVVDKTNDLVELARELTNLAEIVLVSRSSRGALAVNAKQAWQGSCCSRERNVLNTVACGDYFLAGFLAGFCQSRSIPKSLEVAVKAGTIKAWGLEHQQWSQVNQHAIIEILKLA